MEIEEEIDSTRIPVYKFKLLDVSASMKTKIGGEGADS